MKHSKQKANLDSKVLFSSKKPFTYYFLIGFLIVSSTFFLLYQILGKLDIGSSIFCILFFNLILFFLFGRYLCILKLYNNKIVVSYIYPFRYKTEFLFNKIIEIDFRGDTTYNTVGGILLGLTTESTLAPRNNYRGFFRLYLTIEENKLLDIKYNISESENGKFLIQLKHLQQVL